MSKLATLKKGDKVALFMFTGCLSKAEAEIVAADKTSITLIGRIGEMFFDKATGVQTNARDPKYANKIVHLDDFATMPVKGSKLPAKPNKSGKTKTIEPIIEKPAKKVAPKKASKVEDDEYEEV